MALTYSKAGANTGDQRRISCVVVVVVVSTGRGAVVVVCSVVVVDRLPQPASSVVLASKAMENISPSRALNFIILVILMFRTGSGVGNAPAPEPFADGIFGNYQTWTILRVVRSMMTLRSFTMP